MELTEPSLDFFESYQSALREFDEQGVSGFWKLFGPANDAQIYIRTIERYRLAADLPSGSVPASTYWLVDERDFVGHVNVRHCLNAALERWGGHIGYAIRPSRQRRGYGTQILKLVLPHVRSIGIRKALVTCDKGNIASRKIIEKNGGVLSDEISVDGKPTLRYWIEL